MKNFDILNEEVQSGLSGRNSGVPMGLDRLNNYIGIRKRIYTVIGGLAGSGKTSFLDQAYVINPYKWYISKENVTDIKLKIIYFSMERSRVYKLAKWLIGEMFMNHGVIIPMKKLLSWTKQDRLSKDEHDLYLSHKDYLNNMEDIIDIYDGPANPIGIALRIKKYAEDNGKIEQLDKYNKVYIPNNKNEIVIIIVDHIGLLKLTREYNSKKSAIDKLSEELRYARDFYGYVPVIVQQFNRDISNPMRLKSENVEPNLEDFKESSVPCEDADVVMGLFDPTRYNVGDPSNYDLTKLIDADGANYFRSLRVIKNTYGVDSVRIGLAFLGELGLFKELPRRNIITDDVYERVVDKSYFLLK